MIVLIPIGGTGQRFKENGYTKPKALINIFGKPILYYLLDNLQLSTVDYIFIPYNKEYSYYNFEDRLKHDYPSLKFKFFMLENNTRGAAETINISLNYLNEQNDKPVLCLDSDNFYLCDIINKWNGNNCVFTIKDTNVNPIYSYITTDENNYIIDIKEKEKISDNACTGAYGFKSIHQLKTYTAKIIEDNLTQKSEFYTSGVIKEMMMKSLKFQNINIHESTYICLGTPTQVRVFYNNYPRISCENNSILIKSKRICFDLDNTLVSFPTITGDYTTVKPIEKNIKLLRYLKKFSNTIIIYTARRMKTHNGNIGKISADIGKITFDTLDKFNIPYDEVYFGKPYADFYIDDLAINCFDNIEKELGFYNNIIEPRDFNNVETSNMDIITKKGKDLSGEIFYYKHIPDEIKDLFPLLVYSEQNMYKIEKISGLTLHELYISELLSLDTFKHVLNSIIRIQNSKHYTDAEINIYENYTYKLKTRYESFDYSKFKNSEILYTELINKLTEYENNNSGKKLIIHGDPVFTNIIINKYGKIKFIDMRGKIGNTLTIYGDWLYDWAKIYQSLIGYDNILMTKNMSIDYQDKMIRGFQEYFIDNYSEIDFISLKLITKSLLFTLIPLHNNEKCIAYYELIFSKYLL
jgi:capsule biosynthesis phosphatase